MNEQPSTAPLCQCCGFSAPKGSKHTAADCVLATWNEAIQACADACRRLEDFEGFEDGHAHAERLLRLKRPNVAHHPPPQAVGCMGGLGPMLNEAKERR